MTVPQYLVPAGVRVETLEFPRDNPIRYVTFGNRHFYMGRVAAAVLEGLQRGITLAQIRETIKASGGDRAGGPALEELENLVHRHLIPLGLVVIEGAPPVETARLQRPRYIKATITLLSARTAARAAGWLTWAFDPRGAAFLLGAIVLAHAAYLAAFGRSAFSPSLIAAPMASFASVDYAAFYSLLLFSFMLHELGHAAAARRFGARVGGIGFGIYLVFPVFFADVSDTWRLPRGKRIVTSLGGVYLQGAINALLAVAALVTGDDLFKVVVLANVISMLHSLNPFLRFDGYWVYSDAFGIVNLRREAWGFLAQWLEDWRRLRREGWMGESLRILRDRAPLALYSVLCAIFFGYFAFLVVGLAIGMAVALPGAVTQFVETARTGLSPGEILRMTLLAGYAALYLFVACILARPIVRFLFRRGKEETGVSEI